MSTETQQTPPNNFDLFRVSRSKEAVDVCPNTIRFYITKGLPVYRMGKTAFVSREQFKTFVLSKHGQGDFKPKAKKKRGGGK